MNIDPILVQYLHVESWQRRLHSRASANIGPILEFSVGPLETHCLPTLAQSTNTGNQHLRATQVAHHLSTAADPATPHRQFTALFDRVADHCAAQSSTATARPAQEHGWSLEELLKSPIWELELTCSPIDLTTERDPEGAISRRGTTNPHRLFTEETHKRKMPELRYVTSHARARSAPVKRIPSISPTPEGSRGTTKGHPPQQTTHQAARTHHEDRWKPGQTRISARLRYIED